MAEKSEKTELKAAKVYDIKMFRNPLPAVYPAELAKQQDFQQQMDMMFFRYCQVPEFKQLLHSVGGRDASINGTWRDDRTLAALYVRDRADADGAPKVAAAPLNKIYNRIEAILQRGHLDRKSRLLAYRARAAE